MKADRLLSILLLLQARGQMTGRELAKKLEVAERTIHRDMDALSAAGVPVYALRGAQGGWQLDEDWRTQVPGLDEAELRALIMAQPRITGDTKLAAAAERALNKLMAALPVSLREKAASIRQRLFVDTTGWRGTSEDLSMLPVVQDAVSRDRKLSFQYTAAGERGERVVDPLGLVAKGRAWYLVANTPRGFRTYRVSRIEDAKLLETACERPAGFDLEEHWKTSTKQFRESWKRFEAILRVEPGAARNMQTWKIVTRVATEKPDPEGWVTVRVEFDDPEEACFLVRGLGPSAEVVEPASLREKVVEGARKVLERPRE